MTAIFLSLLVLVAILALAAVILKRVAPRLLGQQAPTPTPPASVDKREIDVGSPYKVVKGKHGWMLVNPNDFYLGRAILEYGEYGEIEHAFLQSLLNMRPGKVIEVGANIGTLTVPLAQTLASQQRELLAFEPQPFIFQNLCANLALNGINNVNALPFACGTESGTLFFPRPDYSTQGNFGGISMSSEKSANDVAVKCVSLDEQLGDDTVSLLKIDVEGFELQTLQGAVNILTKSRPILYVENDRPEKSQALIEWLWAQNYRLWWHLPPQYNPDNFFKNGNDIYPGTWSVNMACVPRELGLWVDSQYEIVRSTDHPAKMGDAK